MRVALINGSPKVNKSASQVLLGDLEFYLSEKVEVLEIGLHTTNISEEMLEKFINTDAWVFACPLYVDGIPGHLLSCLNQLEKIPLDHSKIHIYGIVNCGFYEGIQAEFALKIFQNWCAKTGFNWGGGIGIGGGGALTMMPKAKPGHGPKAPVDKVICVIADIIIHKQTQENSYVSVAFPRVLYKFMAQMGWRQMMKGNGGKVKDLGKQPE